MEQHSHKTQKIKHYDANPHTQNYVANALHTRRVPTWKIPCAKVLRLPLNAKHGGTDRRIQTLHHKNQQI